jgi:purine-binding chemotaxis protein CheW
VRRGRHDLWRAQRRGAAGRDARAHHARIVIYSAGRTVGLLVDTAREFVTIPAGAIQPPPEAVSGLSGDYLEGVATVGERIVLILDVDEVLKIANAVTPAREAE